MADIEVDGRGYDFPSTFTLVDPVLVEMVTRVRFGEFLARLQEQNEAAKEAARAAEAGEEPEERTGDPIVLLGLVAVAVAHANPRWKLEKVVEYVSRIDMEAIGGGADEDEADGEAVPPVPAETTPLSVALVPSANPSQESVSA